MNTLVGVAWYKPWEWERLRQVVADPERVEATHREWVRGARKTLRDLQARGLACERVIVGVDELVAWCGERGVPVNAEARSEYAAHKLRLRYLDDEGIPDSERE